MPDTFAVPLPSEYHRWMRHLRWWSFDWFAFSFPAPSCIGTLTQRLQLVGLGPLVPLVALTCGGALLSMVNASEKHTKLEGARRGVLRSVPLALF